MRRSFVVDDTLGFVRAPRTHVVRRDGAPLVVRFRLAREARASLTALDAAGRVVRKLTLRRLGAGDQSLSWDGRGVAGKALPGGRYTIRVTVLGPVGRSELDAPVVLRVAAGTAEVAFSDAADGAPPRDHRCDHRVDR